MTARARTMALGLTAATLLAASSILLAPGAAAAATVQVEINCDADVVVFASPGDTLMVTLGTGCPDGAGGFGSTTDGYLDNPTSVVNGTLFRDLPRNWWVYSDGSGSTTITTVLLPSSTDGALAVGAEVGYAAIDGGGVWQLLYGGPATTAGGSAPAPWHQAYARADQATPCASGYAPSWALWPNEGTGGWTCERSVVWDATAGTWVGIEGSA